MYPSSEILVHLLTDKQKRNTVPEIAAAVQRASSTVRSNLQVMLKHGWVNRSATAPLRYTLTERGRVVASHRQATARADALAEGRS